MTGSFGTLAVLADATIKVLPAPESSRTLCIAGLDDAAAAVLMNKALGGAQDISAAAYLPAGIAVQTTLGSEATTLLRLEGTAISVDHRLGKLEEEAGGKSRVLGEGDAGSLWRSIRDAAFFAEDRGEALWRLSVPPAAGPAVARELGGGVRYFYDWGGGLIWVDLPAAGDGGSAKLRAAMAPIGGHATLVRAPAALRAAIDVFQPMDAALAALTRRVKESFDPLKRFNPGRMYRDV
jgi:glycolate oxidase FAD binding subunit